MNIKEIFINTDLFIDNGYLDSYCNLILENLETPAIKLKTQLHHIVPRHVFKIKQLDVDERDSNKVNLVFKHHILAHYYLALCAADDQVKFYNELALFMMVGDSTLSCEDKSFIQNLDQYPSLYEHACKHNSDAHKGKASWNKGLKYSVGPMSEERKQNISKAALGRYKNHIHINNGQVEKLVPPEEFDNYVTEGYVRGRLPETLSRIHTANIQNPSRGMLGKSLSDYQKECARLAKLGKPVSDKSRALMRQAKVGKIMVSSYELNVSKYIEREELDKYINEGYVLGKLKKNN